MPTIIGYIRATAGDPPPVLKEQQRLLNEGSHPLSRIFTDDGTTTGQPHLQACLGELTRVTC